jgi:regulatory protein
VRSRAGRYGRARIEKELAARGFSRETAAAALSELDGGAEEKALSFLFARIRKASAGLAPEKRRRRIWNALTRRGFAAPAISAKMKREGQAPPLRPGGAGDRDDVG